MEEILQFDLQLFEWINLYGHHSWLDYVMPWWRHKLFWIPLYLFILVYLLMNYGKRGLWVLALALITITVSDTVSSRMIKPTVKRERPCQSEQLADRARVLVHCGSGYSFTSSHATNHFALAVFLALALGSAYRWSGRCLILWAASISYGQVYVGVHYPLDVIAGAALGSLIGFVVYYLGSHYRSMRLPLESHA